MYSGNRLEDNLKMATESSSPGCRLLAVTLPAPSVDPLAAAEERADLSVYWEQPSLGEAAAGFGTALVMQAAQRKAAYELLAEVCRPGQVRWAGAADVPLPRGPWFGGMAFDLACAPGAEWSGFPAARWVVPELLIWTRAGQSFVTSFAPSQDGADAQLQRMEERLRAALATLPVHLREPLSRRNTLNVQSNEVAWHKLVTTALSAIDVGALSKVVAARAIDVAARESFEPIDVLARLRRYAPGCTTFLFAGPAGASFVGATPETLCRVSNGRVETEALAGSAAPGSPAAWTDSDKERREHGAVTDAIVDGLRPLAESVQVASEPSVLALPNVIHLLTPIRAQLKDGVDASEVVRVLHPTPAVGGAPRDRALSFLREHEGLDRGWYAGVVGWMGEGAAELMVALRSALLRGETARVFVGAGVVAGSTPEAEWRETEAKSLPMLEALGGGDAR